MNCVSDLVFKEFRHLQTEVQSLTVRVCVCDHKGRTSNQGEEHE